MDNVTLSQLSAHIDSHKILYTKSFWYLSLLTYDYFWHIRDKETSGNLKKMLW